MGRRMIFLVLVALLVPPAARAAPLVVADIDDTLKITRVRDPWSLALSAFDTNRAFVGTPVLLQALQSNGAEVAYVSAAPRTLATNLHRNFLRQHGYPEGPLELRGRGEAKVAAKLRAIRRLVRDRKPTELVLLGDNGEGDPEVFETLLAEFPRVRIRAFVHAIYREDAVPVRYRPELRPYATPVEVAHELRRGGLLKAADVRAVEADVAAALPGDRAAEEQRSQVFPAWVDCAPALERFLGDVSAAWRDTIRAGCRNGRMLSAAREAARLREAECGLEANAF